MVKSRRSIPAVGARQCPITNWIRRRDAGGGNIGTFTQRGETPKGGLPRGDPKGKGSLYVDRIKGSCLSDIGLDGDSEFQCDFPVPVGVT